MKKIIAFTTLFLLGTAIFAFDLDEQIEDNMKVLKKSEKALKKLEKKGKFKDAEFKKLSLKLVADYGKMKNIKHEEKEFNDMNAKMVKELEAYKKVLESNDFDKIKAGWGKVRNACKECHKEYK